MILSNLNVKLFLWLAGVCAAFLPTSKSAADMIWLKGSETPISGMVLSPGADTIEYRYRQGDQEKTIRVDRADIDDLVVTIDQEILKQLKPDGLRAYLDYAEQLSAFRSDVYAMDLAKRLCLITARWAQPELRNSAFRMLISLCQGEEKVRVQRLAFVYDPTIEFPDAGTTNTTAILDESRTAVVQVIRLIWQDQSNEAKKRLNQELTLIQPVLVAYSGICRMDELMSAANSDELTLNQLGQLLRLEQALSNDVEPSKTRSKGAGDNWSADAGKIENTKSILPDFQNVLPFDPHLTIYRNRNWVAK